MNVLVYDGRGASELCINLTMASLRRVLGRSYDIKRIDATALAKDPWETRCAMLVAPGGRDQPYLEDWNPGAVQKVQKFVKEAGGAYLGICAGGYFGSGRVEFQTPNEQVSEERPLKFLPGTTAFGPVFPGFEYDSHVGAKAAPILWGDEPAARVYCNGSCWFEGDGYKCHDC